MALSVTLVVVLTDPVSSRFFHIGLKKVLNVVKLLMHYIRSKLKLAQSFWYLLNYQFSDGVTDSLIIVVRVSYRCSHLFGR